MRKLKKRIQFLKEEGHMCKIEQHFYKKSRRTGAKVQPYHRVTLRAVAHINAYLEWPIARRKGILSAWRSFAPILA